jgi:branched-chain amino acid transport system permease protein
LSGVYFAIVTLAYPLLLERFIEATAILGGTEGIFGISLFPNKWFEAYIIVGVLLFYLFGLRRLVDEDIGMVFRGIRDNELSITASGMNITRYKLWAVFIASLFGCFGGAYISHVYQWAGMSLFAMDFSIMPIVVTIMGGSGTLAGPVLASYILVSLSEWLREFGTLRMVLYASIIILFITFWREGLLNWLRRKYEQFDSWTQV